MKPGSSDAERRTARGAAADGTAGSPYHPPMSARPVLYKITFLSQGKSIELYAREVASSGLWGFVEVAGLEFAPAGEGLVVDPTEERLREEFGGTRRLHLPMHAVVRVEEVERRGTCRIRDAATGENVIPLPLPGNRPVG